MEIELLQELIENTDELEGMFTNMGTAEQITEMYNLLNTVYGTLILIFIVGLITLVWGFMKWKK